MIRRGSYSFTSSAELSRFDPGRSDKLVATLSHENSSIAEVTYGGVRMSLGARSNTASRLQTAIYYLDSPGSAGDLVVRFNGQPNGVGGSLIALSNTASGEPKVIAQSGKRSIQLTTRVNNSLVVASHVSNGLVVTARAPLTPLCGAPVGSAAGGSGYTRVQSSSKVMFAFSGNGPEPTTVAVAFAPHP